MEIVPSASVAGSYETVSTQWLGGAPPANFTGLIFEAVIDVAEAPPASVHAFALREDQEVRNMTQVPDERGVYILHLFPEDWTNGPLEVEYHAGSEPSASVASEAQYSLIVFTNGPPDWDSTAFG